MNVPYVCVRCRQRANHILRPLKGRSFVSLSPSSTKPDDTNSEVLEAYEQENKRTVKAQDGKAPAQVVGSFDRGKPLESVNSMLERLFESTKRARPDLPVKSRYSQTLNPKYVLVDANAFDTVRNGLNTIQGMIDRDIPTKRVLDAVLMLPGFKNHSGHDTRSTTKKSLRPFLENNKTLWCLLAKVIHERVSLQGSESRAKPVELVQVYIASNAMLEQWWHMILLQLLAEVTKSRTRLGEGGLPILDNSDPQFQRSLYLLSDVIQLWKMFAKSFGAPSKLSYIYDTSSSRNTAVAHENAALAEKWEGLPSPETVSDINRGQPPRFSTQFLFCFPNKSETISTTTFAAAAAITYVFLRAAEQSSIVSESLAAESKPFMDFISQIICNTSSDEPAFITRFSDGLRQRGIVPAVTDQLYDEWRSIRQESMDRQEAKDRQEERDYQEACDRQEARICQEMNDGKEAENTVFMTNTLASSQETSSPNDNNERFMITKEISTNMIPTKPKTPSIRSLLHQATKKSNAKLALKLWERQVKRMSTDRKIDDSVFLDFLRTFFAVGRPDCATEVWNTMCKHGYKPTAMHWVTLLEGCKRTQDLASLKSIWQRMAAAKMENTNQAWTVYISGLLQCKDWRSALKAVKDLGEAWKLSKAPIASKSTEAATTTTEQKVHKADQFASSIVPINAAMFGLMGNRKPNLARQILTWAISENIKPDTTTFNILLRPAVRYNDSEGAQRILAEMKHHACDPDVVTFTILIDGIFRNPASAFQTRSPKAQQAVIVRVFKDMQDNNIHATAHTYTTILDGLLHRKYFNLPAARAVLARMTDHGIRPTPHIYTILVTHYFSLDPPDLHAIDSLWRRIELEKAPVDHILYDRMIEGYGRVGAIDKMLAVLRRMPSEGKRPGWIALLGALRALAQAEEWGLVADLVRDVADEKEGLLRFGSRGWRGKEEFWEFVEVLRGRGVEMPGRGGVGEGGEEDGRVEDGRVEDGGEEDGRVEDGRVEDGTEEDRGEEDGQEQDGGEEDGEEEDGQEEDGGEERNVDSEG